MANIIYVEFNGTEHVVSVSPGLTLMEGAVRNGIPGIDGDCGGACACATCKIDVDAAWTARVGARSKHEDDMLESRADVSNVSRLGCQVQVRAEFEGLRVYMPQSQKS